MSPFVGGAFGSGLRPQYQVFLAVLAAMELEALGPRGADPPADVRVGYRPATIQRLALGADREGKLDAVIHEAIADTSQYEDYQGYDTAGRTCSTSAPTRNSRTSSRGSTADGGRHARAGAATGVYALEWAMDELAVALSSTRSSCGCATTRNETRMRTCPYTSKSCASATARRGRVRLGQAQPGAALDARRQRAGRLGHGDRHLGSAADEDRRAHRAHRRRPREVSCATADIGTGTYTIMTQVAADALGLPLEDVTIKLGDSTLPQSPVEGGSWMAASVALRRRTAAAVRKELLRLARKCEGSPLADAKAEDVVFADGRIVCKEDPTRAVSIADAMRHGKVERIEEESSDELNDDGSYARYTHSAIFAEVKVDEQLGVVRVTRVVNAVAAGRILNPKTARSQIMGGVVWGIGMALHEESCRSQFRPRRERQHRRVPRAGQCRRA